MAGDKAVDSRTLTKATNRVVELGVPLPKDPDPEEVSWPRNVGDLTSDDLAHHLSWWSGWASYIRYHLARAETNAAAFSEEYSVMKQELIVKSDGDYRTVTEMKASIEQLPVMTDCKAKVLEANAMKRMLSALLEGYEQKYNTISREISRRGAEIAGSRT